MESNLVPSQLMPERTRVRATTLRNEASRAIREEILSGQLPPGTRLVEAELATRLGVSRNPIREAIGKLEQLGLVVSIPNVGAQVVQLTPDALREMAILRIDLELLAVRLAFTRPAPGRFDPLIGTVKKMKDLAADQAEFSPEIAGRENLLDAEFHGHLVECSHSEVLQRTWESVAPLDFVFIYDMLYERGQAKARETIGTWAENHARLLALLHYGDRDIALAAVRAHFREAAATKNPYLGDSWMSVLGWE